MQSKHSKLSYCEKVGEDQTKIHKSDYLKQGSKCNLSLVALVLPDINF